MRPLNLNIPQRTFPDSKYVRLQQSLAAQFGLDLEHPWLLHWSQLPVEVSYHQEVINLLRIRLNSALLREVDVLAPISGAPDKAIPQWNLGHMYVIHEKFAFQLTGEETKYPANFLVICLIQELNRLIGI